LSDFQICIGNGYSAKKTLAAGAEAVTEFGEVEAKAITDSWAAADPYQIHLVNGVTPDAADNGKLKATLTNVKIEISK
jgi:hypothetical protein